MTTKRLARTLTSAEAAEIPVGAKYRCITCGHWSKSIAETHRHKDENPACDNRKSL